MTKRVRRRARGLLFAIVSAALASGVPVGASSADSHRAEERGLGKPGFALPDWLSLTSPGGQYVYQSGSNGKFLEDYNLQSGAESHLHIDHYGADGRDFRLRGFGQSGERQGYVIGEYGELGSFDLVLDLQAWTEYYNHRTGEGRPRNLTFGNGSRFFGNSPSTDWFTVGGSFDVQTDSFLHDVYTDFHYRDVHGNQTPLKAGSVDGLLVAGSGPGSVDFDYPARKKVNYDSYMSVAGGHSDLGGINWQTDVVYQYHELQSKLSEPNLVASATGVDEVDRFDEDSKVHVVKYDLAGGRALSSNLFVFGSGFFSYERSDPEPSQFVGSSPSLSLSGTRGTTSSKVSRYTPAASFGTVYQAASNLVISADTSLRGHIANAELDESRDESAFFPGDFGRLFNKVDRYAVVSTTRIDANWKVVPRLTIRGSARYQYRWDEVDSRQDTDIPGRAPEIEKYETDSHRLKLGSSIRYKMRKGRSIEAGYQYSYTAVEQDIDELSNQFILGDYDSQRHRVYLKARGRMMKKLRAELRAHYVYETRDMDAPSVQPGIFAADNGKSETQMWNIRPSLYYLPSKDWSLYANGSAGLLKIEPSSGSAFRYRTLTYSGSAGITYRANEWSATAAYTMYYNDDSVENIGHNASLTGSYEINENWEIHGGYRYLKYDLDGSSNNDYDAGVISLGFTGTF